MKNQRRMGIIAIIVLLSISGLSFVFSDVSFFRGIFSVLVKQLFLMFLYALFPCVPAVILRAVGGIAGRSMIAFAATVLGLLCCVINICLPETALNTNVGIFVFTQCALTSSVPALYCVAFVGKGREIFVALAPSAMFFMSLCVRFMFVNEFSDSVEFVFDQSVLLLMLACLFFTVWAGLFIFVSHIIYNFINRR